MTELTRECGHVGCRTMVPINVKRCAVHAKTDGAQGQRQNKRKYDARRSDSNARRWYDTARWRRMRARVLARANGLCVMCQARGVMTVAGVVDHITPHRNDHALFFDEQNLQALCKRCHDSEKRALERRADAAAGQLNLLSPTAPHPGLPGGGQKLKRARFGDRSPHHIFARDVKKGGV